MRTGALKISLALVALAAAMGILPPTAGAANRFFHTHIDSYSQTRNCGYAEWSTPLGYCTGWAAATPNAGSLKNWMGIAWCNADIASPCLGTEHAHLTLPPGYSRWMKVCTMAGNSECQDYVLGAVKMPNGPFSVMAGKFEGKTVKPSNPNGAVEQPGGPLFLWVGFHSYLSQGGGVPAKTGYVFGLRGYLEFD